MRWLPLAVAGVALATVAAVAAETPAAVRAPLVAVVMLVLPGLGLWRALRLDAPAVSIGALVVLASLVCDVVVAEVLLLAGRLEPVLVVSTLSVVGLLGTLRDLRGARA